MEERHLGQTPDADPRTSADAVAARTRPIDGSPALPVDDGDVAAAKAGGRQADDAVAAMATRGFGSHKGTEAD